MKKLLLVLFLAMTVLFSVNNTHASLYFGLEFTSDPNNWVGGGKSFTTADLNDWNIGILNYGDNGLHGRLKWSDQNGPHIYHLDASAQNDQPLQVGTYTGATRWPFQDPNIPGLSFGGEGRESNAYWGIFKILDVVYSEWGYPKSMAIDWAIYDTILYEGGAPDLTAGLYGQFRYNTEIPFTAPVPIPAAAYLLGSGLVSLVALKRKK